MEKDTSGKPLEIPKGKRIMQTAYLIDTKLNSYAENVYDSKTRFKCKVVSWKNNSYSYNDTEFKGIEAVIRIPYYTFKITDLADDKYTIQLNDTDFNIVSVEAIGYTLNNPKYLKMTLQEVTVLDE